MSLTALDSNPISYSLELSLLDFWKAIYPSQCSFLDSETFFPSIFVAHPAELDSTFGFLYDSITIYFSFGAVYSAWVKKWVSLL